MKNPAQNRRRDPEGVPTGGEFAVERKGETAISTLLGSDEAVEQWRADTLDDRVHEARQASDDNPLDLASHHTRALLDVARRDYADNERKIESLRDQSGEMPLAHPDRRAVHEQLSEVEGKRSGLRMACTVAAVRHGASSAEAREEILREMEERQDDYERQDQVGLTIHPVTYNQMVNSMESALGRARAQGVGEDSCPIPKAEARRMLAEGTVADRYYLTRDTGEPVKVSISSQSSRLQVSRDDQGAKSHLYWMGNKAHRDAQGTIIISDENGVPFVAFTPRGR